MTNEDHEIIVIVARVMVYLGAIWPVILVGGWLIPRFKRGRIREVRWLVFYAAYALWVLAALILHYHFLAGTHRPSHITSYGLLGARASLPLDVTELWLVIGFLFAIPVALRSGLKKNWLFGDGARRYRW